MHELLLTREAQEFYEEADITLAERLNRCFDRLREDAFGDFRRINHYYPG